MDARLYRKTRLTTSLPMMSMVVVTFDDVMVQHAAVMMSWCSTDDVGMTNRPYIYTTSVFCLKRCIIF